MTIDALQTRRRRGMAHRPRPRAAGLAPFDPPADRVGTITADEWASRLGICVGSVQKLIREGVPPRPSCCPRHRGRSRWRLSAVEQGVRENLPPPADT
jgi:hypothetical protein